MNYYRLNRTYPRLYLRQPFPKARQRMDLFIVMAGAAGGVTPAASSEVYMGMTLSVAMTF